jgi:hypothetical protein
MASRRLAVIGFGAALAIGLIGVLVAGLLTDTRQVQTLGVTPVFPVAPLEPKQEACQNDVGLASPLEHVRFNIGTFGKPGPPLTVTVRDRYGLQIGRTGRVAAGWKDDGSAQEVAVGRVHADQKVSVCIRNGGPQTAYVYGDIYDGNIRESITAARPTITPSSGTIDGTPMPGDLALWFVSPEPKSLVARVPAMFDRAATFKPGLVGAWTWWVLLVAALVLVPVALVKAFASALRDEREAPIAPEATNGSGPADRARGRDTVGSHERAPAAERQR